MQSRENKSGLSFVYIFIISIVLLCIFMSCRGGDINPFPDTSIFSQPSPVYRAYASAGWNLTSIDEARAREQVSHYHERGFGGIFITARLGNAGDLPDFYLEPVHSLFIVAENKE